MESNKKANFPDLSFLPFSFFITNHNEIHHFLELFSIDNNKRFLRLFLVLYTRKIYKFLWICMIHEGYQQHIYIYLKFAFLSPQVYWHIRKKNLAKSCLKNFFSSFSHILTIKIEKNPSFSKILKFLSFIINFSYFWIFWNPTYFEFREIDTKS